MKQIVFLVLVSFAFFAVAQAPKEPAKEAAKPEAAKPAAEPAKQASAPAAAGPRNKPRRWNEDARHCLERASTTEIIKCAEEYL